MLFTINILNNILRKTEKVIKQKNYNLLKRLISFRNSKIEDGFILSNKSLIDVTVKYL